MISQSLLLYTIVIIFGVVLVSFLIIIVFQFAYSEEFNYNSCLKYDEEDARICDIIFPPLRFEAV